MTAQQPLVTPTFGWTDALERVELAYTRAAALQDTRRKRGVARRVVTADAKS